MKAARPVFGWSCLRLSQVIKHVIGRFRPLVRGSVKLVLQSKLKLKSRVGTTSDTPAANEHGPVSTKISCDATEKPATSDNTKHALRWSHLVSQATLGLRRSRNRPRSKRESATMWTWRSWSRQSMNWCGNSMTWSRPRRLT